LENLISEQGPVKLRARRKRTTKHVKEGPMPEFGSPFSGLAHDRKLTNEELIRAIRFMVAAEYEAIQLYMQLAESTDNKLAIEVLRDIADEERVHAGEFLRLLHELAPDERKFYDEGAEEVEEEIAKMK
jgi:rubrerythrin